MTEAWRSACAFILMLSWNGSGDMFVKRVYSPSHPLPKKSGGPLAILGTLSEEYKTASDGWVLAKW